MEGGGCEARRYCTDIVGAKFDVRSAEIGAAHFKRST
jgi:hypothetical protein